MIFRNLKSLFATALTVATIPISFAQNGMPVVEYPVADLQPGSPLVVLVSGDGGWAEIDQELAQRWQKRGWPVVGINALKYFWKKRTPDGFAEDLAALLKTYRSRWGERRVLLAGFSFGAVVVPFAANRFNQATRDLIAGMVLISPTENSIWEAGVSSWFGGGDIGPLVAPELVDLSPLPVLVLTGEKDPDAFHGWTAREGLVHEMWPGDHHLSRDYDRIDQAVILFWKTQIAK